jgi:hypothetical protein
MLISQTVFIMPLPTVCRGATSATLVLTLSPTGFNEPSMPNNANASDCKFKFTLIQTCDLANEEPEAKFDNMNFPPYEAGSCPWTALLPCT